MHKVNNEKIAVATEFFLQPMSTCPVNTEVFLENPGGVLVRGKWDGKSTHWLSWSPFPRKQKPIERKQKEALITHKEFW